MPRKKKTVTPQIEEVTDEPKLSGQKLAARNRQKVSDELLAKVLRESGGLILSAQTKLEVRGIKVTRRTIKDRIASSPMLQEVMDDCCEVTLDLCENRLLKKIEEGNWSAIQFYLNCKGAHRGFVKHQEVESNINATEGSVVQVFRLPDNGRNDRELSDD